jgi:hypothetical protein
MAYDAGSVIFKFEADTTNIDKALSDVKSAANNVGSNTINLTNITQVTNNLSSQVNLSQTVTNNMAGMSSAAGVAGIALAGVTAYIALAKKGLSTCKQTMSTIVDITETTFTTAGKIVGTVGDIVSKVSGLETTVNVLQSAFSELGDTISEAFDVDNIEDFVSECIDLGSELTEIQNVVDTVFGSSANDVSEWSSTVISTLGMTESTAKQFTSTFGSILSLSGVSGNKLTEMSENLTSLTSSLASFYNYDYDEMFSKIKSGLTGETEPLKALGINLSEATLSEYLLSKGIETSYSSLSEANKEIVRYAYLMENTSSIQGDFTKTMYSWSNQTKVFEEQIESIKTTLGTFFTDILTPLLIYTNKFLSWINEGLTSLMQKLVSLGILSEDVLNNSSSSSDYSAVLDTVTESADEATKAVNRTISSFDELHTLNDDSSSSSSADTDLSNLLNSVDYSEAEAAEDAWESTFQNIKNMLIDLWNTSDGYDLGTKIATWLNEATESAIEWIDNDLIPFIKKVATIIATFFNGLLDEYDFTQLGVLISKIIETIQTFLSELITKIDWAQLGSDFADLIEGIFTISDNDQESIITRGFSIIKKLVNRLIIAIRSFISEMDKNDTWNDIATQVSDGINSLFGENGINWGVMGETIRNLFIRILSTIATTIEKIDWSQAGAKIGRMLSNLFSTDNNGDSIFTTLSDALANLINGLINFVSSILDTPGLVDEIKQGISDFFTNLKNKLNENDTWNKLFSDYTELKEIIETFFKSAVGAVDWKTVILIAIDAISDMMVYGWEILSVLFTTLVASAVVALGKSGQELSEALWDALVDYAKNGWETLQAFGDWIVEGIATDINDYILPFFKDMFSTIKTDLSSLITSIKEKLTAVKTWISEKLTGFKTSLFNVLSAIKTKLTSAWSWLKTNIFDKISSGVKTMLNAVISTINSLISKLNSISFTMPDWLGGGTFGLSIPTLPLLAEGGYIGANMPTPVVVGDNKTEGEIVAPESKIQENVAIALEPYMSKIESLLTALINSEDEIHVHLEMDGDEITEVVLNNANLATARGGA